MAPEHAHKVLVLLHHGHVVGEMLFPVVLNVGSRLIGITACGRSSGTAPQD